ncbi:chemotaxis protein MotB [Ferrigenium kumadai]|uniref:Chemotaxis protein MotB n=1 Tax=Ferrigenium kumadai TaxID=1682490 RepID=A0AAN1VZC2_9PROT|nr:flagellar motor protein MotB [Ferrigenium kumadai]BBI98376.1 chemotaxis protein MotB [Ferrigenium kumadai]
MAISRTTKSKPLKRPVIVKRIRRRVRARQHGAWKIAYADFVTALLAFFLLMWLTSSVPASELKGVSDYFKTPLSLVLSEGQNNKTNRSVIIGGEGPNPMMKTGMVRDGDIPAPDQRVDPQVARKALHREELQRLELLKRQLEQAIEADLQLSQYKNQLLIDLTTEGLRVQIVDEQNRPMFEKGSAVLQPYTTEILHAIGKILNEVPNKIGLSGHTDATPYQGGSKGYSNWELSADRANASRRELVLGGMDQAKILRVVGLSDSALFNPDDPYDAKNRRISIIVMNREAEEAASTDGGQ